MLKRHWVELVVITGLVVILMVLTGCQTPQQKVEGQSQELKARLDKAWNTAGRTSELAGQSAFEAEAIDAKTPEDSPLKPETKKHAGTAEATAKSAGEAVKAVEGVQKPADELIETATDLAEKTQDTWLTWALRLSPIVLGIALALTIGLVNWKGTLAVLNLLKPIVVPMLLGVASLGLVNLIIAMIPVWMWWTAGVLAALGVIGWLLYRFVPAVRAMSQTIAGTPNAQALAAQVKALGAHVGPLLQGMGTKVTPKK